MPGRSRSATCLLCTRLVWAAALGLLASACGGSESGVMDPRPTSMEPGSGPSGAATAVVIRGEGFLARATQPSSGGDPTIDVRHRAWLGDVELADVAWVDPQTLRATVPPGVPAGPQALEVENPYGRRGRLEAAFVVDASGPELAAALRGPGSAALGADFEVTMTVANSGGAAAALVAPSALALTGSATATLKTGPMPSSAAVPAGGEATFTWTYTAGSTAGTLQLSGSAAGKDAAGAAVAAPTATSPVITLGRAALGVTVAATPAVVSVGQAFTVKATVTSSGSAPVTGITPGAPVLARTGGAGASLTGGPVPTSIAQLDPGQSGAFSFTYSASAAGQLSVTGSASGTDGFSGATVTGTSTVAAGVTVQRTPSLAAALSAPSTAGLKKDFKVTMVVTNSGEASASAVAPTALAVTTVTGLATAALKSGPAPASATLAGGGGTATFTWTYTAGAGAGTLQLSGGATGKDANSGATVAAPTVSSGLVTLN